MNTRKDYLLVKNSGLAYEIYSHGLLLCSFPTKRLAVCRATGIMNEFGLSGVVYA